MDQTVAQTIAKIIETDEHGPYPREGAHIRVFRPDGQVIDGRVGKVYLDLDVVRMYVCPAVVGYGFFKVTPSEGDTWQSL